MPTLLQKGAAPLLFAVISAATSAQPLFTFRATFLFQKVFLWKNLLLFFCKQFQKDLLKVCQADWCQRTKKDTGLIYHSSDKKIVHSSSVFRGFPRKISIAIVLINFIFKTVCIFVSVLVRQFLFFKFHLFQFSCQEWIFMKFMESACLDLLFEK